MKCRPLKLILICGSDIFTLSHNLNIFTFCSHLAQNLHLPSPFKFTHDAVQLYSSDINTFNHICL